MEPLTTLTSQTKQQTQWLCRISSIVLNHSIYLGTFLEEPNELFLTGNVESVFPKYFS